MGPERGKPLNSARTDDHKLNKYIMLVSSPRPNHIVTGVPDKVGNLCYKWTLRKYEVHKQNNYTMYYISPERSQRGDSGSLNYIT
jgi:hypothetical protein